MAEEKNEEEGGRARREREILSCTELAQTGEGGRRVGVGRGVSFNPVASCSTEPPSRRVHQHLLPQQPPFGSSRPRSLLYRGKSVRLRAVRSKLAKGAMEITKLSLLTC
jgi:hypothetical protein